MQNKLQRRTFYGFCIQDRLSAARQLEEEAGQLLSGCPILVSTGYIMLQSCYIRVSSTEKCYTNEHENDFFIYLPGKTLFVTDKYNLKVIQFQNRFSKNFARQILGYREIDFKKNV